MKQLLYSLFFVAGLALSSYAQETVVPSADPDAPDMKFDSETIDFGSLEWDANGIREFKFTNVGKSPLTITAVTAECGCTTTTIDGKQGWPAEPILPGKGGVIKIKYDTKRVGRFEKNITITYAKFATKKVKIKGEIKAKPGGEEAGG